MAVNKVVYSGETLVDLTNDTVSEDVLVEGYTAHTKSGARITGTAVIPTKLSDLEDDIGLTNNVPIGVIVKWAGYVSNIPAGWQLCDGTNGTPDLRGKFVLGADDLEYISHDTGGEAEHTLTTDELPSFDINVGKLWTYEDGVTYTVASGTSYGPFNPKKVTASFDGNNQPISNLPPYYALCYIMKMTETVSIPTSSENIEITSAQLVLQAIYYVGCIIESTTYFDPATKFGFGAWEQMPEGKVLVSAGANYPAGSSGGENEHLLSADELPNIKLSLATNGTALYYSASGYTANNNGTWKGMLHTSGSNLSVDNGGGGQAHNNMQEYIAVYRWTRTA